MDKEMGKSFPRDKQEAPQKQEKRIRRPWPAVIAKIAIVPFLLFLALVVGLFIGYSVIGKHSASEVFDLNTYKHMYDLIFAGT